MVAVVAVSVRHKWWKWETVAGRELIVACAYYLVTAETQLSDGKELRNSFLCREYMRVRHLLMKLRRYFESYLKTAYFTLPQKRKRPKDFSLGLICARVLYEPALISCRARR